jgi:hypothetical protein
MSYELPLQPPYNKWEDHECPRFIEDLIETVAHDIDLKGVRTRYNELYDVLYMYIYENIDRFYPDDHVI